MENYGKNFESKNYNELVRMVGGHSVSFGTYAATCIISFSFPILLQGGFFNYKINLLYVNLKGVLLS